MAEALIEFKNVTKRFGTRTILDQINLKVHDGQVTTIIGKSGTGKSVLLKHMIGLLSPTEGNILFRGKLIDRMSLPLNRIFPSVGERKLLEVEEQSRNRT